MGLISFIIIFIYAILIIGIVLGNNKLKNESSEVNSLKSVTVIVALRNEEEHIRSLCEALFNQNYAKDRLDFIFVNDQSTDQTNSLLNECSVSCPFNFQILELSENFGKKASIKKGVELAKGDFILTTDADCVMSPEWVNTMLGEAEKDHAEFLIGCVQMTKNQGWFPVFQQTEFAAIMACTSGSSGAGRPLVCNGANLGFTKKLFDELEPYNGNLSIASGDDVFFMHKAKAASEKVTIKFVSNSKAVVKTKMAPTFIQFTQQRIRWAKKSRYFNDRDSKLFGFMLLTIHLLFVVQILSVFLNNGAIDLFVVTIGIKFVLDTTLLYSARKWIGLQGIFWKSIILSIVYPIYFLSFAFLSLRTKVIWKGRQV